MRRFAPFIVLGLGLTLVVAGCGRSEVERTHDYEVAMRAEGQRVDELLERLEPTPAEPLSETDLRDIATQLRERVDAIDAIGAPEPVAGAHADLLDGLRSLADALDDVAAHVASAGGDDARRRAFLDGMRAEGYREAWRSVERARDAYAKADYRVLA